MSLSDFTTAVNALMPAGTTFGLGSPALREHGTPPRVVWVPIGGPIRAGQVNRSPRQLATRELRLEAHLWAAGISEAEELLTALVRAVRATAYGSVTWGQERWEDQDGGGIMQLGQALVVDLTVQLPVTAPDYTTATATTAATTKVFVRPDGSEEPG